MAKQTRKKVDTEKPIVFTLQEVTKILLKNEKITEGYYFAHITPQVRGGAIEINDEEDKDAEKMLVQGVIIGLGGIELRKVSEDMPLAVDASQLD